MKKGGLGKGLSALLRDDFSTAFQENASITRMIPVNQIVPNPYQHRSVFDEEEINELARSIEMSGLLQPLIIRKKRGSDQFELVSGERRLRAVKKLDWEYVPAVVRDVEDKEMSVLAVVENVQRKDISPLEEAAAYKKMIEFFGMTQEEIARVVGKSRARISNALRLLTLPKEVQEKIDRGELSYSHGRELASIAKEKGVDEALQKAEEITKKGIPVNRVAKESVADAPFVAELEKQLMQAMGTKVKVDYNNRKKNGRIIIDFYSLEELERLTKLFSNGRDRYEGSGFGIN